MPFYHEMQIIGLWGRDNDKSFKALPFWREEDIIGLWGPEKDTSRQELPFARENNIIGLWGRDPTERGLKDMPFRHFDNFTDEMPNPIRKRELRRMARA